MNFDIYGYVQEAINRFTGIRKMDKIWKAPLIAAIPAGGPEIAEFKNTVTPDHFMPEDILEGAKSIISMFIPFEDRIAESNIIGEAASEEWARAYICTNELLDFLGADLTERFHREGFRAELTKATHNFNEKTLVSRWSHRHIAYLAGLGTFGINNMLITKNGCCGRFNSILTNIESRELGLPIGSIINTEYCLSKRNGSCGLCQKKCPGNAYDKEGKFDRHSCYEACLKNAALHKNLGLADVCGKCLVGLPCSIKRP